MTAVAGRAPFDIGEVPQSAFGVLSRNFPSFFILAIVLSGVPTLVFQWLNASIFAAPSGIEGRVLLIFLSLIVNMVAAFLLQAALVTGAISDLNGRKIGVSDMISGRMSLIPSLFGLAIVQGVAEALGFLLLFVPGLILMTVWAVTVPAAVIERTGVSGALSRSADLTRGHRWSVFALILVFFIALWVVSLVGTTLLGGFRGLTALSGVQGASALAQRPNIGLIAFNAVLQVFTSMVGATGIAVIYYELRRARDGVAPQALIDTFS
jgi:hypothetical protein